MKNKQSSIEESAQELTIGSRVIPDMWNKEAYDYFSKRGPKWILKPKVNAVIYDIQKDGNNVTWIKLLWKPKRENPKTRFLTLTHWLNSEHLNNIYIVLKSLTEQNEDEFSEPIESRPDKQMSNKQSSVEWLTQEINKLNVSTKARLFIKKLANVAEEMHKEEITNSHLAGQNSAEELDGQTEIQYYNETFKGGNK